MKKLPEMLWIIDFYLLNLLLPSKNENFQNWLIFQLFFINVWNPNLAKCSNSNMVFLFIRNKIWYVMKTVISTNCINNFCLCIKSSKIKDFMQNSQFQSKRFMSLLHIISQVILEKSVWNYYKALEQMRSINIRNSWYTPSYEP